MSKTTAVFVSGVIFMLGACGNKSTTQDGSVAGKGGSGGSPGVDSGMGTGGMGTGGRGGTGGMGGSMGTGGMVTGPGRVGNPCTSDNACSGVAAICVSGACAKCTADSQCFGLFCDTTTGLCRDCVTDANCVGHSNGPICDQKSRQCTRTCTTGADCTAPMGPTACHEGRCRDCIPSTAAPGTLTSYCEGNTFSWVGCRDDRDCKPAAPFCSPSHDCSPDCMQDSDCPMIHSGSPHCDPAIRRCVECYLNSHCPGGFCQTDYTCG